MHLGESARREISRSVELAREISGLAFGVYVGPLPEGTLSAKARHAELATPESAVLLALDPQARTIEIVTGTEAHVVLDDRSCELALLTFASNLSADDFVGGIRETLLLLAEHARKPLVHHLDEPS